MQGRHDKCKGGMTNAPDVRVGEDEFTDGWLQCEAMRARTHGDDHHGGRAVE